MKRWLFCCGIMLVWLSGLVCAAQVKTEGIGMVTGSSVGTYIQFGQDIAGIARTAGLDIAVKESEGSIDNIRRLTSRENAALAIVQSDVLGFLSRSEDPEARRIAERLRLVFPFYNEEVHLFARKEIRRFEDLNDRRVVIGTKGSGNWLTSNNLLRMVNVKPAERIELPPPEGVSAVLVGEADAMVYVAGKPVKLFTTIRELQKSPQYAGFVKEVHFVPLQHESMLKEYVASTIGPDDYEWLNETIPTVAVKAVLISFDFSSRSNAYYQQRCEQLAKLGRVVRQNSMELQRIGHAKWKEVKLDQDLGIWKRDACSQPARRELAKEAIEENLSKALTEILKGKRPAR